MPTWGPWAAGPGRPASRRSSGGEGAGGGPRPPARGHSAAAAAGAALPHTAPAGSSRCAPAPAAGWTLPAAGPAHAVERGRGIWQKIKQTHFLQAKGAMNGVIRYKIPEIPCISRILLRIFAYKPTTCIAPCWRETVTKLFKCTIFLRVVEGAALHVSWGLRTEYIREELEITLI